MAVQSYTEGVRFSPDELDIMRFVSTQVAMVIERKLAEDATRAALNEKEVLLREVHHRVKNNLQVMSSLLSLQADTIDLPVAQEHFLEMQARVRSMALIHEELYQSTDLARINFALYLDKLANSLQQTYLINPSVQLHLDVDEIYLNVDTAIPCGLMINELVTNAFKHAFPKGYAGEVVIRMQRGAGECYQLEVCDNGIGLPEGLELDATETLGMQLVTILARQLRGTVRVERDQGTRFQILFQEYHAVKRAVVMSKAR
jgi:two-component sensor histidine kinase